MFLTEYNMYDGYLQSIASMIHSPVHTWEFKSNHDYCYVLEHVNEEQGKAYLFEIRNRFTALYVANKEYLITLCLINDYYGKPNTFNFSSFASCSATNLRYILHSFLILTYMKECRLNNIDIIEIGGGYGGLCFFMHKLSHLFDISIRTYSIFDLEMPLLLQKKYLEHVHIPNVNFVDLNNIKNLSTNSFLISNYAYSEIPLDIQKQYTDKVLNPYVSHGFLAWNLADQYTFIANKEIMREDEYPLTFNRNKYVRFKPM